MPFGYWFDGLDWSLHDLHEAIGLHLIYSQYWDNSETSQKLFESHSVAQVKRNKSEFLFYTIKYFLVLPIEIFFVNQSVSSIFLSHQINTIH